MTNYQLQEAYAKQQEKYNSDREIVTSHSYKTPDEKNNNQ